MERRVEVSAVAAQALARAAAHRGVSAQALCRASGVAGLPSDPLSRLPSADADALCATAHALTGAPTLGLEAAQLVVDDAWPLVDRLATSSATLEAAFRAIAGAFGVIDPRCRFTVTSHRIGLRVRFTVGPHRLTPPPLAEDFTWAVLVLRLRRAVGVPFSPTVVRLARPGPRDARPWRTLFGAMPTFGAGTSELVVSRRDAALPCQTSSPLLHRALTPLVGHRRTGPGLLERATAVLDERLDAGRPTLDALALALDLSPRTLQRRLREEGTSYEALLTGRRVARAEALLLDGVTVAEVSRAVGFGDQTSLTRAFRRVHALGPSAWRRTHRSR
jgi:AraC-like DNA-binding protein